jgi:hypothetical protein
MFGTKDVIDAGDVIEAKLLGQDRIVADDTRVKAEQLLAEMKANLHSCPTGILDS